jgi:hypothetical protein
MTPNPVKNLLASIVRTVAPMAVGSVATWLARKYDVVLDEATKASALIYITGVVSGLYYVAVRLVETYVTPKISFLLADFRKGHTEPIYPDATATIVVPPANQPPGE